MLLCVAIISSMLLTSVFAANYPGIDKPDDDRTGHWVTLGKSVDDVENARDLGGYTANINGKEYVIKDKMLFRSGHLQNADVDALRANNITKVIDLRTSLEALRKPDVKDSKITNVPISMLTIPNLFVMESEDWRTLLGAIRSGIMETWDTNLYRQYIQDPQAIKATKQFFEEVVASAKEGKAVLWHCTAGKDRTGIEAMLLMAALGCDYSTILNEFLQTNVYYEEKAQASYDKVYKLIPIKAIANEFYKYEIVRKTWLQDVSMEVMKRETNTDNYEDALEAYLLNVIELDSADREILRNAYLVGYESSIGVSDDRTQSLILESAA